eukprot:Gregarina_sp_Poly_1__1629@NODE_1414_length_4200_cov_93_272199_g139_i1_p1_GENE_NODE_1414_length_4200_cov_93_272199_g139_i1NODE_1414_length_4200_cov_93_272199_g139_i1_p1_ORF_typecomplete_len603_score73_96DUF1768/PF08719_11/3_9e12FHA/PF00498_26/7_8e10YopYscD_cpl/PF16697_5/1_8e09YopYscD_cpl/PF16697_5/1_6e04Limkainb1/PF11608_8/0_024RRM_1/PF00076_22/1_1e04RRM_1/PF00076_22/5_8e03RRM_1/PF00076_22/0_055FHA_2/PF17913_1/0_39_NODE_1414_length_4200_cov_93_272199_g139_i114483256
MGLARRLDLRDSSGKRQNLLNRGGGSAGDEEDYGTGETLIASTTTITSGPSRPVHSSDDEIKAGQSGKGDDVFGVNAITNFTGDFEYLHPDYPSCVAVPAEVSDVGDFHQCKFFPSIAAAMAYLHYKVDSDRLGISSTPLSDEECLEFLKLRHSDVRDAIEELEHQQQQEVRSQIWEAHASKCIELLTRDKFRRHRGLLAKLLATGDRTLVYSDTTKPVEHTRDLIIEPDHFFGRGYFTGENVVGRALMKVREDMRQGHRGLLRWLIQLLPVERDCSRRLKLKVFEGKADESGENVEHIATHDLERKYDIREYFESSMKVDRQQLFVTFPDNEKEDTVDTTAVWRKRKKQKLIDELTGAEGQDDSTASSMMITIGKLAENEITCLNPSVSRTHVAIVPLQRSRVVAVDLGSKGGTTRNGVALVPLVPVLLQPGDRLRLGQSARVFTVQFRALSEQDLIRLKREELEKRLSSLNASINSSASSHDSSERSRTIRLEGLSGHTDVEDIEDALAAFALQAERIQVEGGRPHYSSHGRRNDYGRGGSNKSATVVFRSRVDAWKARESLNDRGVKGRTVHVSISKENIAKFERVGCLGLIGGCLRLH